MISLIEECGLAFGAILVASWVATLGLILFRWTRWRVRRFDFARAWRAAQRLLDKRDAGEVEQVEPAPLIGLLREALLREDPAEYFHVRRPLVVRDHRRPDDRTSRSLWAIVFGLPYIGLLGTLIGTSDAMRSAAVGLDVDVMAILGPTSRAYATTILAIVPALAAGVAEIFFSFASIDDDEKRLCDLIEHGLAVERIDRRLEAEQLDDELASFTQEALS